MRGSPILQAVVLLFVMLVAGLLGRSYLAAGHQPATATPPKPENPDHEHTVEAEVELVFSSAPLSYTLRKSPIDSAGEPIVLLRGERPEENPVYHDIQVDAHGTVTYWLDVTWSAAPAAGGRHFVQVKLSPNYGAEAQVSYSTSGETIQQAFDHGHERSAEHE